MDSEDESRPGSSASNSSDSSDDNNSDNNSRASSPEAPKRSKSGSVKSAASIKSAASVKSNASIKSGSASPQSGGERAVSRSSRVSSRSSRASSKSNSGSSSSSSSSSSDDDDDAGSAKEVPKSPSKPASSRSSSEESGAQQRQGAVSRNQSISPVRRKSRSSRNSSVSSAGGSLDDHREDGAINMSHEDLSDVSEMDSEKRLDHNITETTKMSVDDEATNGSVSNVNEPVRQEPDDHDEDKEEPQVEEHNSRHSRHNDDDDDDDDEDDDDDNAGDVPKRDDKKPKQDDDKQDSEKDSSDNREKEQENKREDQQQQDDDDLEESIITDLRQKLDKKKACQQKIAEETNEVHKNNGNLESDLDELVKKHDEDALDFEAEEGECPEVSKEEQDKIDHQEAAVKVKEDESKKSDGEAEEGEELEEGEVSDEDEKRPEETEPKPVCRFYTRGQCTWGMSCRFLHPGVTDKGNYTMFDMVRPVSVPSGGGGGGSGRPPLGAAFGHDNYHDFRSERPPLHHRAPPLLHHPAIPFVAHHDPRAIPPVVAPEPPIVESAWERGLRTAKEMMRKANKRKEQDMDFEDKKMNLTLSPEDVEKDNYYIKDRATPPEVVPQYPRHQNYQEPAGLYPPPERFARGPPPIYDDLDPYGRSARYRELPAHRMPHYEDERRVRPAREVIVQRVEPVGRGDEWNDPWMRSKSPGGRALSDRERSDKRRRDRRSYSSNSSYSSSTSSQSDSSSESSRSPSPENRRRYNSGSHKSPTARRHFRAGGGGGLRSPSPRRPRRSPSIVRSPVAKRRGHSSPSPIPDKRAVYSPGGRKRRAASPPLKRQTDRTKKKRRGSSSSGSGSSDSSGSGSDSSSSSSESSSQSRGATPVKRVRTMDKIANERKPVKKIEAVKKRSPISIEIKKQATVGASALTSPSNSNSSDKPEVKDMKKNRREELLKQLRAVEDAIAKKRSKLT